MKNRPRERLNSYMKIFTERVFINLTDVRWTKSDFLFSICINVTLVRRNVKTQGHSTQWEVLIWWFPRLY